VPQADFSDAIAAAAAQMRVEIADTPEQVIEAQRLRYKVYCEERGYEPGSNGLEQDEFDATSCHVLVRGLNSGIVFGTVRVVLASRVAGHDSFPMQRVCERYVLAPLPASATAEISRFALTRDRCGLDPSAATLMRLFLMRGIVQISGQNGLTHWCAMMESSLLRMLRATSIHFQAVGPTVEHHGTRQPAITAIGSMLDRIRLERPQAWSFFTNNGTFWQEDEVLARYSA
jgi:N-acyl-L-homoserine lactone synthetase